MKQFILLTVVATTLGLGLSAAGLSLCAAELDEESQQITRLQSNRSLQEKDAACAWLKRIGTARSVPALAALLTDEQLSHYARYALESMPWPEASQALIDSLDKTRGLTQAGLINSLGNRRETAAVPVLAKRLADADAVINTAAASALGKIAGTEALKALSAAWPGATGATRVAVVDALLAVANRMLAEGDRTAASAVFQKLYEAKEPDYIRTAAYSGLIRAAGDRALSLVISAISRGDGASQIAALQLARDIQDRGATKAFTELLATASPAVRIALIGVLSQRGAAAPAPAVVLLASGKDPEVRLAALAALGRLGDASAVPVLAEALASSIQDEQKAARQSLLELRGGDVSEALLRQMAAARPAAQAELARVLGGRAEKSTVPRLMEMARSQTGPPQSAALRALALLADGQHLAPLVKILQDTKSEAARSEVQETLISICQRLQTQPGFDVEPLVQGMNDRNAETRIALLTVCRGLSDPRIGPALRAARGDADPRIRDAALRAMCETRDAGLLPDLLAVTGEAKEASFRVLAMRGYVRLVTEEENIKLSTPQRADLMKQILTMAQRVEEKRLVLAGLANLPDPAALKLVVPFLEDTAVQAEAVRAVTQMAGAMAASHPELASTALKKALLMGTDVTQRQAVQAVLKKMEAMADFITAWQVAGPYQKNDLDYRALFDTAFPPETAEATNAAWRTVPVGTDPQKPWRMDLLKVLGGEQRVAYARTRLYSEQEQPAILELGSDDGIKVWFNGRLVHTNNTARALTAGSDKVNVNLHPGWNSLMLKITQNNLGWEYCVRVVKPDGSRLKDLRFNPADE
jgi:HEAT repeat protein